MTGKPQEDERAELADRVREIRNSDTEELTSLEELNGDNKSPSELLNWLCWSWAVDGERFYPPDETAKECADALEKSDDSELVGYEEGYHTRAYLEAIERFNDLQVRGFDPVGRTKRHIEQSRERGLDLEDIDWSWLEASESNDQD